MSGSKKSSGSDQYQTQSTYPTLKWPEPLTHETGPIVAALKRLLVVGPTEHVCDAEARAFSSHARALPRTLTRLERQLKAENEALRAQVENRREAFEALRAELTESQERSWSLSAEIEELTQGAESLEHQRAAWEQAFRQCAELAGSRLAVLRAVVSVFGGKVDGGRLSWLSDEQNRVLGMARAEVNSVALAVRS